MITAITTCMGRLEHLETTLPLMLEEFDHVIVVDWSCPQKSGEWAFSQGAQMVYSPGQKYFHASAARNLGARAAPGDSFCFLDADTIVWPGLKSELEQALLADNMAVAVRNPQNIDIANLNGFIAVKSSHFWRVGGYNEAIEGYALEDAYLRAQLCLEVGLQVRRVSLLAAIRHSNELRGKFHQHSIHESSARNHTILQEYLRSQGVSDWLTDPRTTDIIYRNS